jgi:phosphoribosylformylglycinamidine synthase
VAIIREEGSNGDREMSAAVYAAGMQPWDVTMSDLLAGRVTLDDFRGIVFVGGFSYADTLDSAKGWAATIRFNEKVLQQFEAFYARPDTFSLGICNGCQLMALLGWVPASSGGSSAQLPDSQQPRFVHNASGRFESRWVMVEIDESSPAVMLKGMGGMRAGIWCAHGEGKALFPDEQVKAHVLQNNLAPVRYVDQDGKQTEQYPFNPNGSPLGIAAMCSADGRHLAMMPHPERCYLGWQLPWSPPELGIDPKGPAPWLKLFQNAREWSESQ